VTNQDRRRWRLLEGEPALTRPGWLPPAEDCPALADLREAHERVLAATAEASRAALDLRRQQEAELEAVRSAEEEALFSGKLAEVPTVTVGDQEVTEAGERAQAARDALQRFVQHAVEQVREREPEIVAALDEARTEAATKRAEARRLQAEADELERTPKRITLWLDRTCGRSHLGHFPYEELAAPASPEPLDLEAALAGGDYTEVMTNA
jgi:DNA primase